MPWVLDRLPVGTSAESTRTTQAGVKRPAIEARGRPTRATASHEAVKICPAPSVSSYSMRKGNERRTRQQNTAAERNSGRPSSPAATAPPRSGAKGPVTEVQGYLWMRDNGSPLMVAAERNFVADRSDPMVPHRADPARCTSRPGCCSTARRAAATGHGCSRSTRSRASPPEDYRAKAIPFTELISIDPDRALQPRDRARDRRAPGGRADRPARQGPALPDRVAAQGRQDHAAAADGPRDRRQPPQHHDLRAAGGRAARGGHRLEAEHRPRRGLRVVVGPVASRATSRSRRWSSSGHAGWWSSARTWSSSWTR